MKLTIVIPAKNEEANIGNLLFDLSRQVGIHGILSEIIIADALSTDNTRELAFALARNYGFTLGIIDGGLPAVGRNLGAEKSTTKYTLFLDADVRLYDPTLIYKTMLFAELNDYWMVTTHTFCDSPSILSRAIYQLSCLAVVASKYLWKPFSTGMFMLVNTGPFRLFGGFDPTVLYAEDFHLSMRYPRFRFGIYRRSGIYTSDRRLKKMGNFGMVWLFLRTMLNTWNTSFFKKSHDYWK